MEQKEIKDYLLQLQRDSQDRIRGYIKNSPENLEEAQDYGHAVGQMEVAENMVNMFFDEE
jgi:hypothetical protein